MSLIARLSALAYGLLCYSVGSGALFYTALFLANFQVPLGIDTGEPGPLITSIAINLALIGLFGLQHSIMARPAFKQLWWRIVPEPVERSTYVLAVALVLGCIFVFWQPLPQTLWSIKSPLLYPLIWSLYVFGWLLTFAATFMHNHFDLMGLRQVWRYARGKPQKPAPFRERALYKHIRHPLMLGLLIAFWSTPHMTLGHLVFSAGMTVYIYIGVAFEERDLLKAYGESYSRFRESRPMLIPHLKKLFPGTSHRRS